MTEIFVSDSIFDFASACESCGATTRIYGVEPHPRLARTEVHTYVCDACDRSQVLVVPLPKAD